MDEKLVRKIIREELEEFLASDRYIFSKPVQFLEGRHIQLGRTNGTKIGTAEGQKLALWGATPVDRPDFIADPTGGLTVDSPARTAIASILDLLIEIGAMKSS